jgi:hypothetical protein
MILEFYLGASISKKRYAFARLMKVVEEPEDCGLNVNFHRFL